MNAPRRFPIFNRKAHEIIAFHHGVGIDARAFLQRALALAGRLPPKAYVFNLCTDRFNYLLSFCAATIAGQCTLMPPNRLSSTLSQLSADYPDNYQLLDDDLQLLEAEGSASGDFEVPTIPLEQLCAVAFTSGSTGTPTANLKYWETLRSSTIGNAQLLLASADERINLVATVPPQHMWGLETSILLPLFANATVSDRTPFYPQDIADALMAIPEPRVLVSSPVHLNVLYKSQVQLPELECIFSATAPMSRSLAQNLEQQYKTRVIEVFGSSESGIVARRNTASDTIWQLSELFGLQVCEHGVRIEAQHLPDEVFIKDVIQMVDKKHFKWLGRHQDMLNIAGKRGSLADLNRRLLAIKGVSDGVMFLPTADSTRVAALVVAPGLKARDIQAALKPEVESIFMPRPILLVDSLPRQATGKLAHKDVLQTYCGLTGQTNIDLNNAGQ